MGVIQVSAKYYDVWVKYDGVEVKFTRDRSKATVFESFEGAQLVVRTFGQTKFKYRVVKWFPVSK